MFIAKLYQAKYSLTHSLTVWITHAFTHSLLHLPIDLPTYRLTNSLSQARTFFLVLLLFGENPQAVAYSAQPLCWSGWETTPLTTHRAAVQKNVIIQWKRQRHLTWYATYDIVSREINLWKSLDLLLGSKLWPLSTKYMVLQDVVEPQAVIISCLTRYREAL